MVGAIPHLSVDGWIKNKEIIMLKLFEHFIASEYSQSNIYQGTVVSLKYLTHNHTEVYDLQQAISLALTKMYEAYFKHVEVIITVKEVDTANLDISIDIDAMDYDDVRYSLSKSISEIDGKVHNFDELMEEIYNVYNKDK